MYKTLNWDHWAPGYPKGDGSDDGAKANCGAIKVGTDPAPPDNGFWVDVDCASKNVRCSKRSIFIELK